MAVLDIPIPDLAWRFGSPSDAPAPLDFFSAGATAPNFARHLFDGAAGDFYLQSIFRVPIGYASTPIFLIDWYGNNTNDAQRAAWRMKVSAIAAGESIVAASFSGSDSSANDQSATTANVLIQSTIALTTPTIAEGDLLVLSLWAQGSAQDLTNPPYFLGGAFRYTT